MLAGPGTEEVEQDVDVDEVDEEEGEGDSDVDEMEAIGRVEAEEDPATMDVSGGAGEEATFSLCLAVYVRVAKLFVVSVIVCCSFSSAELVLAGVVAPEESCLRHPQAASEDRGS